MAAGTYLYANKVDKTLTVQSMTEEARNMRAL